MIRVGVDVGGTFTDIVLEQTAAGESLENLRTQGVVTPADQSIAVVQGVVEVCKIAGVSPGDIDLVLHGTTVATNMVIERKGADVGMITTRGFRDILHMARHKRPHNFSLQFDVPWQSKPLVKRRNRLVVDERLRPPTGEVEVSARARSGRSCGGTFQKARPQVHRHLLFVFVSQQRARGPGSRRREARNSDAFVCCSHEVVNSKTNGRRR